MKQHSLRTRLVVSFCILIVFSWAVSTGIAYVKTRHRVRHTFDAQQLIFAHYLESTLLDNLVDNAKKSPLLHIKQGNFKKANEALSFAIFDKQGTKLLADRPDEKEFTYSPETIKPNELPEFYDSPKWRILWYETTDKKYFIAVGQENSYRNKLTQAVIVDHQITPWLILLPILILTIFYLINNELKPIKRTSQLLASRRPDDSTPIIDAQLPVEIQPLVNSLNSLFLRVSSTIEQERRFVSNAAHELRTPLAALKVQTEVAQLSQDKPEIQQHALNNLNIGITRVTNLIEQLLTLSRVDAINNTMIKQPIDWFDIIADVQNQLVDKVQEKNITLSIEGLTDLPCILGNPLLITAMLYNLLNNALIYTKPDTQVSIIGTHSTLSVIDQGPGVDEQFLPMLTQRFFRPSGQAQTGSGLGLSIVKQIAELHNIKMVLGNRNEGGFYVTLQLLPGS